MGHVTDLTILLLVVLIAVLLWRGPRMLPRLGESFGAAVRGARRTARETFERRDDGDGGEGAGGGSSSGR